jgi:hypothetical protein
MGRTTPSSVFSYIPHLYKLGEVMQVTIIMAYYGCKGNMAGDRIYQVRPLSLACGQIENVWAIIKENGK